MIALIITPRKDVDTEIQEMSCTLIPRIAKSVLFRFLILVLVNKLHSSFSNMLFIVRSKTSNRGPMAGGGVILSQDSKTERSN